MTNIINKKYNSLREDIGVLHEEQTSKCKDFMSDISKIHWEAIPRSVFGFKCGEYRKFIPKEVLHHCGEVYISGDWPRLDGAGMIQSKFDNCSVEFKDMRVLR